MTRRTFDATDLEIVNGRARVKRAGAPNTNSANPSTKLVDGYRSKLEAYYAQRLDALKYAKEIRTWVYEPIKLKLAERTFYSPDFFIVSSEGRLIFHEVKGFMRDDAAVKLKVAARLFPWFDFWLVTRSKGDWHAKHVSGG